MSVLGARVVCWSVLRLDDSEGDNEWLLIWSQLDDIVDDDKQSVMRPDGNRGDDGGLLSFIELYESVDNFRYVRVPGQGWKSAVVRF